MTAFQSKLKKFNIVSQHSTKRGMAIFSLIIIFSMLLAMPAQVAQSAPQPAVLQADAPLAPQAITATFTETNSTSGTIPDGPTGQSGCAFWPATRYFLVDEYYTVNDLNVRLNVTHDTRGELQVTLISPAGTKRVIVATSGDTNNNYDITLDGDSGGALNDSSSDDTAGGADRTVLQALLNDFEGENAHGAWLMSLCDNSEGGNNGTYNTATTLTFDGTLVTALPLNHKQGPAQVETYYLPFPEDQLWTAMNTIFSPGRAVSGDDTCADFETYDGNPRQPFVNYIGITIPDSGTVVTYDQWEDGFEADLTFPTQNSTQVWGDGDLLNGVAPKDPDDLLVSGQILILNDVMLTTTLGAIVDFDARDKIGASKPIAVTRSGWSDGSQTMFAAADEVYPTSDWGTEYQLPVGEDFDRYEMFQYTGVSVMAAVNGTVVSIDKNADGAAEQTCNLNQGQSCQWDDNYSPIIGNGLNRGSKITSNSGHPVQVSLLTGDYCAGFATRTYSLLPVASWSTNYYSPVSSDTTDGADPDDDDPTTVHLYNPNGSIITVSYVFGGGGTSSVTLGPRLGANVQQTDLLGGNFYSGTASNGSYNARDEFANQAFDNSNGTLPWSTNWDEAGDGTDSPTAGSIQINGNLRFYFSDGSPVGDTIERQVNLSGATAATLSFSQTNSATESGDRVVVEVSSNGGSSWTQVGPTLVGNTTPAFSQSITSYISANTRIRFRITADDGGTTEYIAVDNVDINATFPGAASALPFFAVASVDSDLKGTGTYDQSSAYDWGYTLMPQKLMSQYVIAGWAPGDDPSFLGTAAENTAPIWLTGGHPTGSATPTATYNICIDDGGNGGALYDSVVQRYYDRTVTGITPRQQVKVYYNNAQVAGQDQTGTQIWVCGPTGTDAIITAAWGADPNTAARSKPGLDMGFTVRNLRTWLATKGVTLLVDNNGDGLYDMGDTVRYSVVVKNTGGVAIPAGTLNVKDTPPAGVTYVLSSTTVKDHNNNTSAIPDGVGTPFPLDESGYTYGQGLPPGGSFTVSFDMTINSGFTAVTVLTNQAQVTDGEQTLLPEVSITVQYPPKPGVIGNYVWLDEDGDGDQDAGEAGIPNVEVKLCADAACTQVLATTYTDANGGYLFSKTAAGADLAAGTYYVQVTPPAGMNQTYDENGGLNNYSTVVLNTGQEYMTADFGYNWNTPAETNGNTGNGAIGDRVWVDVDPDGAGPLTPNGMQDAEEVGIEGVTVELYTAGPDGLFGTADDILYATDTTDANGNYIFDNLPADSYVVKVVPPIGYSQTGDPDATLDNKTTAPIVLGPGDVYVNADFGYTPTSAVVGDIGDTLWVDADRDGVIDGSEARLPGVTVSLIKDTNGNGVWDAGEPVIATDITDSSGQYLFNDVPAGAGQDYLVWVNDTHNVLGELKPTFDSDGTGTPNISAVQNLTAAGNLTQDFGYAPVNHDAGDGMIGDTVFLDMDGDGVYDPGEGMEGVIVRLYDTNGNILAATVTNENGQYFFGNLPAGTYVVQVQTASMPAGLTNTVDPDGGNNSSSTVVLAAGGINLAQDFGYRDTTQPNSISGTIWKDTDADGTLEGGEAGRFGGVTVVLRDTNGDIVATTTTAPDGSYSFTNLPDGTYTVDVTDSANVLDGWWKSNGTNPGGDNNSQLDPYTVTVSGGQNNTTADFGYYRDPGAIGNFIWYDANEDGIQDAGEGGLVGVKVTLQITYPDGTVVNLVTETDANGYYSFKNLLLDEDFDGVGTFATPGVGGGNEPAFVVKVDVPAGMAASPSNQGGNPALDSDWALNGVQVYPLQGMEDLTIDFGFNPGPTGFDLASFMAIAHNDGSVQVEWITLSELDTVGFYLYRSTSLDGVRELVTPGMILARGAGSFYQFIDENTVPGQTYYYWMHMVVAPDNTEVELDIQPAVSGGMKVYLPIIIR